MYALVLDRIPLAVAERFQRLVEAMADYTGAEQARMVIVPDVEVLE